MCDTQLYFIITLFNLALSDDCTVYTKQVSAIYTISE